MLVTDPNKWLNKSSIDKILQFVSLISHQRKDIRLGGVICLYLMIQASSIPNDVLTIISEEVIRSL